MILSKQRSRLVDHYGTSTLGGSFRIFEYGTKRLEVLSGHERDVATGVALNTTDTEMEKLVMPDLEQVWPVPIPLVILELMVEFARVHPEDFLHFERRSEADVKARVLLYDASRTEEDVAKDVLTRTEYFMLGYGVFTQRSSHMLCYGVFKHAA